MWIEKINEYKKNNEEYLNLQLEIHQAKYLSELLNDKFSFNVIKTKSKNSKHNLEINNIDDNELLSYEEFFMWYQTDFFNELISEEEGIFLKFNELKNKLMNAISELENKEKKENSDKEKINKLRNHLKNEMDKSNLYINELKRVRLLYPTFKSFEILISGIIIINL
jgi:hypothetical protein